MSQGNSIFSSPNGSNGANGDAPANPFASLGGGNGAQKAASPFAAAPAAQAESPFGFAAEEPTAERKEAVRLPEKKAAPSQPAPPADDNPFQTAASATPSGELDGSKVIAESAPAPAPASPFSEATFEAPKQEEAFAASAAPAPAAEREPAPAPAPAPAVEREPAPAPAPAASAPAQAAPPQPQAQPPQHAAPQPQAQAAPPQAAPPQAAPAMNTGGHSTRQLELRAIFGSEGEMSRDEILTRAKGLPGIREVAIVGPGEMSAVQTMGDVLSRFGYGGNGAWQITCAGGVMDFISGEGATLAVLREGRYSAGVWETLMIVARELGKL